MAASRRTNIELPFPTGLAYRWRAKLYPLSSLLMGQSRKRLRRAVCQRSLCHRQRCDFGRIRPGVSICSLLPFCRQRLTMKLIDERESSGTLMGQCCSESLADRIAVMRKAHTGRKFCSVLPAIGKYD